MGIQRTYGAYFRCDECGASIELTGESHIDKVYEWAESRGWEIDYTSTPKAVTCCHCAGNDPVGTGDE